MQNVGVTDLIALNEREWATAEWPLGTHPSADGVSFAVHAPAATRVQLEIYPEALGADATDTFLLAKGADGVWRGKLQGLQLGALTGYRVWGPNWPYIDGWTPGSDLGFIADLDEDGNRFNPNKVLFDPYSREITHNVYTDQLHQFGVNDGVFGTGGDLVDGAPRRLIDTGRYAPKGIVIAEDTYVTPKPHIPGEKSVIYEVQVEQLTGHPSASCLSQLLSKEPGFEGVVDIPEEYRGTYKGAGMMAPYLKALGMTSVELLPIHETNSSESGRSGASNSWGYNTLGFFAPNRQYSSDKGWGGPTREFKEMVSAFHEAGLEVYLDVVYNHTAEGGNWGGDVNTTGFTSLGGFCHGGVLPDDQFQDPGRLRHWHLQPAQLLLGRRQELVLDSLKYWTRDMHVDGFRFDPGHRAGSQAR